MSIALVKAVSEMEESGPLHLARLMLILLEASRRTAKSVDGPADSTMLRAGGNTCQSALVQKTGIL